APWTSCRASSAPPTSPSTPPCSTASTSSCRRAPTSTRPTPDGPRPPSPTRHCAGSTSPGGSVVSQGAAASRAPPAGGEGDVVAAGLELLEGPLVAGRADPPVAVGLHVLVGVEGGSPDGEPELGQDHHVVQGPDAAGRRRPGEVDLRMVDPVAAEEGLRAHRVAQESEDGLATLELVGAAAVGGGCVGREAALELVPELLVEAAHVPVLEPLHGLDLDELVRIHGPSG